MSKLPNTFTVDIEGVGKFIFKRRTMEREFSIQAQVQRISGGEQLTGTMLSMVRAEAPEGWDIDGMDALDDESYLRIADVFSALRTAEDAARANRA
jgi:hypothetical protein